MSRAQPTDHISPAPSGEVKWTFQVVDTGAGVTIIRDVVTVKARSFFAARELAARKGHVDRDSVRLVRK